MSEVILAAAAVTAVAVPVLILGLYATRLRKLKAEYDETRESIRYAFRTYRERLDSHEVRIESLTRSLNESTGSLRWLRGRVSGQERRIAKVTEATITSLEASKRALDHSLTMEGRLKQLELQVEKDRDALKSLEEAASLRRGRAVVASVQEASPRTPEAAEANTEAGAPAGLPMAEGTLARLTETELKVLDVLRTEGAKTSRELERMIGRTREHTARVMKKLYLEGYVDRDTHKLPYVYRVNEKLKAALQRGS
ncbi:MAG: helix-turn-helix domain-containing protein [Candidatus Bathyarchaeia archaeon]